MILAFPKSYVVLPPLSRPVEMGFARSRIEIEGDVLTVLCRSAAPRVWLQGGINEPMRRIGDSDEWAVRLRMPGWDRAFFAYGFTANENWAFPEGEWRGPHAPRPPARAARLQGRIVSRTFRSRTLGEDRKLFVYLPPGPSKSLRPAFFITDGAECERFAQVLEPLILARRVRPCVIVGVDHGGYRGDIMKGYDERLNYRSREYVPGVEPLRFARHRRFFTEEVPAYATREFGVSTRREDRATMGYSDGATFLLNLAADRPGFAAMVLPLSPYAPFRRAFPAPRPRFFLSAGTLETPLDGYATALHRRLPGSALAVYVAGHSPDQWELAFARFAPAVFPPSGARSMTPLRTSASIRDPGYHRRKPMNPLSLAALAPLAASPAQTGWTPKHAPIGTRWAKDVSPTNALPEYPRPQTVRRKWINLNGVWELGTGAAPGAEPPSRGD